MNEPDSLSEAARRLAAQRRRTIVTCVVCGRQFEATPRRMYCSRACNQRALRWRRGATARGGNP